MSKKDKGPVKRGRKQNDEERWDIYLPSVQQHKEDESEKKAGLILKGVATIEPKQQTNR